MEGPCSPVSAQGPEACEQGQEGRGVGSQGSLKEMAAGAVLGDGQQAPPGQRDLRGGSAWVRFGGRGIGKPIWPWGWRDLWGTGLSPLLSLSVPPHPQGPLRSMVEGLQSEESDEDDSSSGEEAAGKTNAGRDSRCLGWWESGWMGGARGAGLLVFSKRRKELERGTS